MRATFVHKHCFRQALFSVALSILLWQSAAGRLAEGQEVDFKPRWDGVEKPKRVRTPENTLNPQGAGQLAPVFSFGRYRSRLREICNLMEFDRRRERLGKIAFEDLRNGNPCKSCRPLLKEVVEQCQYRKKVVVRPTVAARPAETATSMADQNATPLADFTPAVGSRSAENNAPEAARYPRTDLLDATSALSVEFYERDSGQGATFESVKYFADLIERQGDLSPAERDYFGIFTSYLLSAWMGRPDSPLEASEPSKEEIRELFQAP